MQSPARKRSNAKYRAKHRERIRAIMRAYLPQWRAENPDKVKKYDQAKYTQYHLPRMAADPKYREHMRAKWRASKRRQKNSRVFVEG